MNTRTTPTAVWAAPWLSACALVVLAASAHAQNQRYYPQQQGGYAPSQPYTQPAPSYPQQPPPGYGGYQQPQGGYGYQQPQQPQTQYENPIQFLPKFGKRMSEMVRRVFYGQDPTGWDNPPPGYNGGYPQGGGQSLDGAPRGYQPAPSYPQQPSTGIYPPPAQYPYPSTPQVPGQGGVQPRYSYPPQQPAPTSSSRSSQLPPARTQQPPATQSKPPAPATQSKSSTSRTYSPPKVTQSPPKTNSAASSSKTASSKAKTQEQPPSTPSAPPPSTTTRRSDAAQRESPPPTTASNSSSSSSSSSQKSSLGSGSFLKGKKTAKAGRVISPYPPYKELDITGLESGSLALDPTTQKVFEVP